MEPTTDRVQCRIQGTSCHKQSWINSQPGTAMNYFICVILLILESRRRGSLGYLDFQLLLSTYLREIDNSFVLKILFCLSLNKTYSCLFSSVFLFYFCNSAWVRGLMFVQACPSRNLQEIPTANSIPIFACLLNFATVLLGAKRCKQPSAILFALPATYV